MKTKLTQRSVQTSSASHSPVLGLLSDFKAPEVRSDFALDELFKMSAMGDSEALLAYARIVCKHVGQLNGLVPTHAKSIRPFSRHQLRWPILKSTRKSHSENERQILDALQIGEDCGEAIHRDRRFRQTGKLSWLVRDSLEFVDLHRRIRNGEDRFFAPMQLARSREDFPGIVLHQFGKKAELGAALKAGRFSAHTVDEWERFIVTAFRTLLEQRTRKPADIGWLKHFASKSKARSFGRAKEQFLRLLSKRIRSLAGKVG